MIPTLIGVCTCTGMIALQLMRTNTLFKPKLGVLQLAEWYSVFCRSFVFFFLSFWFKVKEDQLTMIKVCIYVDLVSYRFSIIISCEQMSLSYLETTHLGVEVPEPAKSLNILIIMLFFYAVIRQLTGKCTYLTLPSCVVIIYIHIIYYILVTECSLSSHEPKSGILSL